MSQDSGEFPYVFAYDITSNARRAEVLKCLKRWRVGGQYSVHETWLRTFQVRDLSAEILGLVDREADSVLVCRLSQRQAKPVYQVQHQQQVSPLVGKIQPGPVPAQLVNGWYLFCYDIRENRRLQKIQRATAKQAYSLQRSVYLFQGNGAILKKLITQVSDLMKDDDDLRIYVLASPSDIWFLTHDAPPLPQFQKQQAAKKEGLWQKLLTWFR
jgi:CRISPR-associated endonuclease Cas2